MKYIGRKPLLKPVNTNNFNDVEVTATLGKLFKFDGTKWVAASGSGSNIDVDTIDGLDASAFGLASQFTDIDTALQPGDDANELSASGNEGTFLKSSGGQAVWSNLPNVEDFEYATGSDGQVLTAGAANATTFEDLTAGDVNGPASSQDGNLFAFDGTTGKLIKDSGVPFALLQYKFTYPGVAGYIPNGTTIDKLSFPGEIYTTSVATFPAQPDYYAQLSNPSVAGYSPRNASTTVYKTDYSTESISTTTSLIGIMNDGAGYSNPSISGYFIRGNETADHYKYAFPGDVTSSLTQFPSTIGSRATASNPGVAGYISLYPSPDLIPFGLKIPFATETFSDTISSLYSHLSSFSNPGVAGYFYMNNGELDKISFATDTVSFMSDIYVPYTDYITASEGGGFSNPGVAGYLATDEKINSPFNRVILKIDFPSETYSITILDTNSWGDGAAFANA